MRIGDHTRAIMQQQARPWFFLRPLFFFFLISSLTPTLQGDAASGPTIQDIRFRSAPDETRVVIEVDRPVPYQIGRLSEPNRVYIDLPETQLAPDWERHQVQIDDERLQTIRIAQNHSDQVRIVLDLKVLGDFRIYTLSDPFRIVIDLRGTVAASGNGAKASRAPPSSPTAPAAPPKTSHRPTVVIDPGHGGKDPGAISRGGLEEKTVVLQTAKELRRIFHTTLPHYRVVLTRERDVFIPLGQRARIANQYQAQLFISLHVNASKKRHVHGIETWYLSFAANARAKSMAARENQMSEAQLSDLEIILRDMHETDRINQSASLATTMQTVLTKHMASRYRSINNRGIDGAPFVVLMHTAMPSVLVEIGFISNSRDERRLRSRPYQREVAQGIFHGVRQFLQTSVALSE